MNLADNRLGVSWRPELALAIERRPDLGFVEIIAEDFPLGLPPALKALKDRGLKIIPHGVSLSLGGTDPPAPHRLQALAELARACEAPLVSEHLAFVRAGGLETGHLLPLPRTARMLEILLEHIRQARAALPVPLALENIAGLFQWPDNQMTEAEFLTEVLIQADVGLLLDVENVYANARNHGFDALEFLEALPLDRLAYVHVAGGMERDGVWHDTHTFDTPGPVLELLEELSARVEVPGVSLERDGRFPALEEFNAELDAIAAAVRRGQARRVRSHVYIGA